MKPLILSSYTTVSALGRGNAAALAALRGGHSGLRPADFEDATLETWIGRVEGLEQEPLEGELGHFDCRNNRLAMAGLRSDGFMASVQVARSRYGAGRIGLFLGTSTSGIRATERAFTQRDEAGALPADYLAHYRYHHSPFSLAAFVRQALGLDGPAQIVATACSSSAKVFATASRHIAAGLCDAAVVGGVDSLCLSTLYGFNSLQLVSPQRCRPWDAARDGINIGEAAGFALLEPATGDDARVALLGYGESSDAYHMSSPHPEGVGAAQAMEAALSRAGVKAAAVDYINLHGTGTPANDASEDRAVCALFGSDTPCSSTKGWTGHTLGAAGITEAIFSVLCIERGFMPASLNTAQRDPALQAGILTENRDAEVKRVLTNSLGFGGTNCALLLGRPA